MARQGFWFWSYHHFHAHNNPTLDSARIFDTQPPSGSTVERLIGRVTVQAGIDSSASLQIAWPVFTGVCHSSSALSPLAGTSPGYMGQEWMWWEMIHATAADIFSVDTDPPGFFGTTSVAIDVRGKRVLDNPGDLRFVLQLPGAAPPGDGYLDVMAHWRAFILYP